MSKRILATQVGSLPKSDAALMALGANPKEYQGAIKENIFKVVGKQIEVGLDIVNDGEAGRRSFIGYVSERLSGFETEKSMSPPTCLVAGRKGISRLLRNAWWTVFLEIQMHRCDRVHRLS